MIVLDEHFCDPLIMADISAWYSGQVIPLIRLRPGSLIKDDAIPALLRKVPDPIFVTINVADFWKRIRPHNDFCIITAALTQAQVNEVSNLLRRLLHLTEFKTKTLRMGKVIHVTRNHIQYYESDRRIHSIHW